MVKIRGLDVGRYSQAQLRRLWYGLGCISARRVQNRRGEVMRDIRDEGMGLPPTSMVRPSMPRASNFSPRGPHAHAGCAAVPHRPVRCRGSVVRAPGV